MRFSEWSRHSFMGFGSCFPKNPLKKRHITIFLFWGWAPLPPPNLNFVKIWGFRERSKWIMLQGESSDWVRSFCIVSIMYRGYRKKLLEPLEHVLNMFTRSALTFVTDFAEMVYAPNFRAWAVLSGPLFWDGFWRHFWKMYKKEIWEAREHFITELDDMTLADVWWDCKCLLGIR